MPTISTTKNKLLMQQARSALQGTWSLAAAATFVYFLALIVVNMASSFVLGSFGIIIELLLTGPMAIGLVSIMLSITRRQNGKLAQVFDGFSRFGVSIAAFFLTGLFTLLWALLLVVPGIIAAYSYAMTYYILIDNPTMGALEAIKKSKAMMRGNKWKYACLSFRFIGWGLLAAVPLSIGLIGYVWALFEGKAWAPLTLIPAMIGLLWLVPYMMVSNARFYEEIKSS